MEVKFVDVGHGYAAFAPEKPISQSQNAHDDSPFAFLSGDVVASERPVVCWQQMISRYPTAPLASVCDHSETANSDVEGSSGGGIFRSCAYCLNSLLTVAEEAVRLESIVDSERNACRSPPSGDDVSVRDLFLQTVLQNAFVEFLPSSSEEDYLVSCSTSSSSPSPVRGREINQLGGEEQMNSLRRYRAVTWKRSALALAQQRSNSQATSPPNARDAQEDGPNAWASACYLTAIPSHSLDVCVSLPSSSEENRTMQLEEGEQGKEEVARERGISLVGEQKEEEEEDEGGYEKKEGQQAKGNVIIPFSAPPPSYSLLLRSVKRTQRHVVLYDGSVEGNKVPPHTESEGKDGGISGAWVLSFCDRVCLASFEKEFGASHWLLGQKVVGLKRGELRNTSGTNSCEEEKAVEEEEEEERDGDCEDTTFYDGYDNMGPSCFSMNLARDPNAMPTSTRVDPHLKALFSQYFLFDESFNSRALQKCFGPGEEDTSTRCNDGGRVAGSSSDDFVSLASSPLVAELRSEVWDLIYTDFIINGRRSSSTVMERRQLDEERDLVKHKQVHGLGNSEMQQGGHENGTVTSEIATSCTSCATDHQHAALGRCLMAIYTLSSTFNERFKMILLVVCKALTSLLEKSDTRLNRRPHPSASSSAAADGRNTTNIVSIFSRLEAHLLDSFCASYEEGPFRKYTWRQRETLRAFCTLLNEWIGLLEVLLLSQEEEDDCRGLFSSQQKRRYVSIQTVQTISMVLDANAHACVIINPIYAAICGHQQQLDIETSDVNRNEVNEEEKEKRIFVSGEKGRNRNENESIRKMPNSPESLGTKQLDGIRTSDASLSLSILIHRFASPNLHHNLGVALYDRCTKINHSCRPNVKFIPTFAPVRAVVVARGVAGALLHHRAAADQEDARDRGDDKTEMAGIGGSGAGGIIWGEEIRTSYLDIDEEFSEKRLFESLTQGTTDRSVVNNERRRQFLRENYGFECDCLRCVEDKS